MKTSGPESNEDWQDLYFTMLRNAEEALECARDVLVGKGNLESFQRACEKTGVKV